MECLRDRIGLEGCGANTPASSLSVNSLPGITVKSIESLANEERATAVSVWDTIQTRAIYRFTTELRAKLAAKYKLNSALQSLDLGQVVDTGTTTGAVSGEYRGPVFDLGRGIEDDKKRSSFTAHAIKEIKFYATANQNGATFKVFDCSTGTALWTKTQNLVTGWNTIAVNQTFTAQKVWVAFLAASLSTVTLTIDGDINTCQGCKAYVTGGTGSIATAITESTNAHGLSVVYTLTCKLDALACSNPELFDLPLWYLMGAELMLERLRSDRINKWTVNREQAKELKDFYDAEFERVLNMTVNGLTLDTSDICLECNNMIQVKSSPVFGC